MPATSAASLARRLERFARARVDGQAAQEPAEQLAILPGVQAAEQLFLGGAQLLVELGPGAAALRGGHDPPGPPVSRVGAALDEPGGLEVVEQVGHDRAVHAQALGQGLLAAVLVAGGRGEDLVTAGTAGEVGQGLVHGLDVAAEDGAERPAQVVAQRAGLGVRPGGSPGSGQGSRRRRHEVRLPQIG